MLRLSTLFLRTLREDPADAEVPSHRLLVRAGCVRRVAPGIFAWLPLGYLVYRNVERIIRAEMDQYANAQLYPEEWQLDGLIEDAEKIYAPQSRLKK